MNDLLKYINIKNPLFRFSLFLTLFGLVSLADLLIPTTIQTQRNQYLFRFIFTFITGVSVYYITRYGFGRLAANPINFYVSTWIIFLLIHPTNNTWYFSLAVGAIAVGKLIWRNNNLPVLNPAAFGLVITYIVSVVMSWLNPEMDTLLVSWWGADMFQFITENIPILNVVIPLFFFFGFLYFAHAFKKVPYVLSFFISFLLLTFITAFSRTSLPVATSLLFAMLFNSTAFCALVMIPEPKTSPNFLKQQLIVGIIAGVSLWLFNTILITWPIDPLINAVIVANVATVILKIIDQRSRRQNTVSQPSIAPDLPATQNTSLVQSS